LLLAFTALASTSIALTTELAFACAGRKAWILRPGPFALAARKLYRWLDRSIPLLSCVAAAASLAFAVSVGVTTRAGCMAVAGVVTFGAHLALYAQVARRFRADTECLGVSRVPPSELAQLQSRWEIAMATRASLLAAAFVCVVTSVILG
jgi:hypothetical protein